MTFPSSSPSAEVVGSVERTGWNGVQWRETFPPTWLWLAAGALFLGSLLFQLDTRALLDPDEGRNAEISLEMAQSGHVLTPTLEGMPFVDKPFLFFSASALAMRLCGPSELTARLPSLFFYLATAWLTAAFARRLFDRSTARVALLLVLTAPMCQVFAQTAIFDATLTFFTTLALVAFFRAVEAYRDPSAGSGRGFTALAWLAMTLGIFTKGPVALAVPLVVVVPFAFRRGASRIVWHPAGWGLCLALVIPWLVATEAAVPGFLRHSLLTETWSRVTTNSMHRTGPIWYFVPVLLGATFPWSLVALFGMRRREWASLDPTEKEGLTYLLLWIALPLVLFSLSKSKLPHYILPLTPAVALLAARAIRGSASRRSLRAAGIGWVALSTILLIAAVLIATRAVPIRAADYQAIVADATPLVFELALVLLAAGAAGWYWCERRGTALFALALPLLLLPLLLQPLSGILGRHHSTRQLAAALEGVMAKDAEVLGVETYSPSLSFYLERPLVVLSATGKPLTSSFIESTYAKWVDAKGSPLRSPLSLSALLRSCSPTDVLLLRPSERKWQKQLAARNVPVLFRTGRLVAMGPCGAATEGGARSPRPDGVPHLGSGS